MLAPDHMPPIPVAGFVLEAFGAALLAVILASFQRQRPRAGVPEWSLGMWTLAAALLASIAVDAARPLPSLRRVLFVLAVVLAYWVPALLVAGTWARWNDREVVVLRWRLLAGLALFGAATTLASEVMPAWRTNPSFRRAHRAHGRGAARGRRVAAAGGARRAGFGTRILALSFLGRALENGLFAVVWFARSGATASTLRLPSNLLIESELLLLMLAGVGMVAWLLEEERESAVRLHEVLQREEALSVMGALVAGVAHEVRNPLFGISANLDALGTRIPQGTAARPFLAAMRDQVVRLNGLMTELLDYGRPPAGEFTREAVRGVLAEALAACAPLGTRAGVSLEDATPDAARSEAEAWQVRMDRPRLRQVFQNLVQNAVEHTPRGGRVLVSVEREVCEGRPGVRCCVRDSGPGFAPADLPRVFEPFFSRRRGGTGLGLSIVQRIVEQHSGRAWAANHPEGGGLLTVWLPEAAE